MKLKPKSTVHNPRALLYKRFTDLETSIASDRGVLYYTEDQKYWRFSQEMVKFFEIDGASDQTTAISVGGLTFEKALSFKNIYFVYRIIGGIGKWEEWHNVIDINQAFHEVDFSLDISQEEETIEIDQTEMLTGYILPQPFPERITASILYESQTAIYIFGGEIVITDNDGRFGRYSSDENQFSLSQTGVDDNISNRNSIHLYGVFYLYYPITAQCTNGIITRDVDKIEPNEGEALIMMEADDGYYSPFVISVMGADILSPTGVYGYEFDSSEAYISLKNAIAPVSVSVMFTNNVVVITSDSQEGGVITAKFVDYYSLEDREVETRTYIDANHLIVYSLMVDNDFDYKFTGRYNGVDYTDQALVKYETNGEYYIKSPSGENQWQFAIEDSNYSKTISETRSI